MSDYSLLLVDDDEELLASFTTWFSRRGFHVTAANHPQMALAAAAYNKFDVAVIDIILPEMNGLELIDQLKPLTDAPTIVLSGDDNPKLLDAAIALGVYRFLLKPIAMRAVEETVRDCIKDSPIHRSTHVRANSLDSVS